MVAPVRTILHPFLLPVPSSREQPLQLVSITEQCGQGPPEMTGQAVLCQLLVSELCVNPALRDTSSVALGFPTGERRGFLPAESMRVEVLVQKVKGLLCKHEEQS